MLTLYHYDRSTAAQRVRLVLEEKKIKWKSIIVDTARGDVEQLPKNYHTLNPKGLVPVIINKGSAIPESLVILEYIEDKFPIPSFKPQDPESIAKMRLWMNKINDGIHIASRTIGVCIVNRHIYNAEKKSKISEYYAKMKDSVRKKNDQINIEFGLDSPLLPDAVTAFKNLFEEMNHTLKDSPWLAGDSYSLADIALVVYLRRMESFMMAPLWKNLKYLNQWYRLISSRTAYVEAVTKWGDITEEKRKINGLEAFSKISKFWNEK